jgi:Holliday junction resolvase
MVQRESEREKELISLLNKNRIIAKRVESKGGSRGVLDLLCYTEDGALFIIEVKDGSVLSIEQEVTLKNVRYSWEAKKEKSEWVFTYYYLHKTGIKPIDMGLNNILTIVNGGIK